MQAVILTGIVAGFVHVVSGADHLIAMAPAAINNPQKALKNSFSWGLGHSSGVLLLAFLAIFIKDITPLNKFSSIAEFLVGISLLIVGVFAIKNSLQLSIHSHSHNGLRITQGIQRTFCASSTACTGHILYRYVERSHGISLDTTYLANKFCI